MDNTKGFLTPDDWGIDDEERTTAQQDESMPGWWIIENGDKSFYIHEDEIAALHNLAFP